MSSLTGNMGFGGGTGSPMKEKIPSGYKKGTLQQFTPEQMQLFQQLFGQVSPDSFTARLAGGDQSQFAQMEAPAMKQFGALQAGLASKFSGMGMGGRRSSGFQNTQSQAASDFAQQLQGQRLGLQRQAIQDLMGMSSNLLGQRPYENYLIEKQQKQGPWGMVGGALGGLGGFALGGPAGALAGANAGYNIGSQF